MAEYIDIMLNQVPNLKFKKIFRLNSKDLLCLLGDIQLRVCHIYIHILYDSLMLMDDSLHVVLYHSMKLIITKRNILSYEKKDNRSLIDSFFYLPD